MQRNCLDDPIRIGSSKTSITLVLATIPLGIDASLGEYNQACVCAFALPCEIEHLFAEGTDGCPKWAHV